MATKKDAKEIKEVPVTEKRQKSRRNRTKRFLTAVLILIVAVGVGLLGKAYLNQKQRADRLTNPTEAVKEETRLLIQKVGSLTELPNEEPTIATVSDVTKLQDQPFFKNAQNGDKVLIFTQAKKAILYRPSTEKIVEIAPVNLGENQQPGTQTESKPTGSTENDSESGTDSENSAETNTRE